SGQGSVDYLNTKRVPVIGTEAGEEWPLSSPMYFTVSAVGSIGARTWLPPVARQVVPEGKTKAGTLVCVEAQTCDEFDRTPAEQAKAFGMTMVYRGRISIAQPDYTAECLAARNAGVEVLMIASVTSSVSRILA